MTHPHPSGLWGSPTEPEVAKDPDLAVATAIAQGRLATLPAESGLDDCDVAERATCADVMGELSSGDAAWLAGHVESCDWCASALSRAGAFHRTLGDLGRSKDVELPTELPPLAFRAGRSTGPARRERAALARGAARPVRVGRVESPVGDLLLAVSADGICEVGFAARTSWDALLDRLRGSGFAPDVAAGPSGELADAARQVGEYFAGQRRGIDLPVDLGHVTPFTRSVLEATRLIPYGQTSTYGDVARRIGRPSASRAVGNALGRNPVPLVIPCHRVVRGDRTTGGFMGNFVGGPEIKRQLLSLEGATAVGR
jgi:methylated-DNA-[protein]-cysteine S-methyltransferase